MKKEMSSFDILAAVAEMQPLVGGRIDQVYQVAADAIVLRVRTPDKDKSEVYVQAGKWVCLRENVEKPQSPPPFGMALRRSISNAVLEAVEQRGFERIVVLRLRKRETHGLVLELFGKGNVVLVKEGVIVQPLYLQSWRGREVRPGETYEFPPERVNPLAMTQEEFLAVLAQSERDLVRTLALDLNLGGTYAEELCARAGLDKSGKASNIGEKEAAALYAALRSMAEAVATVEEPTLVLDRGKIVDVTPVPLTIHSQYDSEPAESFTRGLAAYLDAVDSMPAEEGPKDVRRANLARRLVNLEEGRRELLRREADFREAAELIYANFQRVEEALAAAQEGEWTETIRDMDFEKGRVTVDIDGKTVRLDVRLGANQNADALYQRAKEAQSRAAGLLEAIEEAKKRLEEVEAVPLEAKPSARPGKRFWFEHYRWFVSSEGHLVLGGRDAKSNETLVKKHLKPGDRYVHADVHGAPSVVVRKGAKAGEDTLTEACAFGVAYSKLWRAKAGSGSAYWVNPEQVSKTPQTGEFLARGAFVVRGKRNYRRGLPLRVGVGLMTYEGEAKVMAGPPSAVASRCTSYVTLVPGDGSRETLAASLGKAWNVPREEILRCLPPGGVDVVEAVPAGIFASH
jgi:predicted ribosome quality control (RQC) complex YloA/Tae2 family protein